jgi:hypothetical protein
MVFNATSKNISVISLLISQKVKYKIRHDQVQLHKIHNKHLYIIVCVLAEFRSFENENDVSGINCGSQFQETMFTKYFVFM